MNTFELENNRLIKNLVQLMGVDEQALAHEIGVSNVELASWKRGKEIPGSYKRKMQQLTLMAEHSRNFMSMIDKMRQGLEDGSFFREANGEVLTEAEAAFTEAIHAVIGDTIDDFELWNTHNHHVIYALKNRFDHNVFSAYVFNRPDGYILFPDFVHSFAEISTVYHSWICQQKRISSLHEVGCETAHLLIDIIIDLTCSELIEIGFDSDYDDSHEISSDFRIAAFKAIESLLEATLFLYDEIDVNYFSLLVPFEELNEAVCMAELCGEDFDVGLDDPSEKIDQYLPLGTREILKTNREILLQSYRISNFIHRTQLGEQSVITALVNATQELSRIKGELKERSDTKVVLKVNEKILRTCKAILAERGFQL